uniref:Uncharacterized protein MANES_04G003000 n=1 Tax=Rhizophora mucronata TaxID=61149 RepID=A0A2P2NFJ8_RHIMU
MIPSIILENQYTSRHKNSDSLQLCTEGLGFKSSDNVEDLKTEMNKGWQHQEKKLSVESHSMLENTSRESGKMRPSRGAFPPLISCIGKSGRPVVCFKSYRQDSRFVLKEVRIPTQELLHARREDGRLKLQFIQQHDEAKYEEGKEENFTEDDEQEQTEETANSCDHHDHHDHNTNNRAEEN